MPFNSLMINAMINALSAIAGETPSCVRNHLEFNKTIITSSVRFMYSRSMKMQTIKPTSRGDGTMRAITAYELTHVDTASRSLRASI